MRAAPPPHLTASFHHLAHPSSTPPSVSSNPTCCLAPRACTDPLDAPDVASCCNSSPHCFFWRREDRLGVHIGPSGTGGESVRKWRVPANPSTRLQPPSYPQPCETFWCAQVHGLPWERTVRQKKTLLSVVWCSGPFFLGTNYIMIFTKGPTEQKCRCL